MEYLNHWSEIIQTIPNIKTGISLIAFIAVLIVLYFISKNRSDNNKLKKIPEDQRGDYLIALSEKYHLKDDNLTKNQRYDLVKRTLRNNFNWRISILVLIMIVLTGFLLIFGLNTNGKNDLPKKISVEINNENLHDSFNFKLQFVGAGKTDWDSFSPGIIQTHSIPGHPGDSLHFKIEHQGYRAINETLVLGDGNFNFTLSPLTYWIKFDSKCDTLDYQSQLEGFRNSFNDEFNSTLLLDEKDPDIILTFSFSGEIEKVEKTNETNGNCNYHGGYLTISGNKKTDSLDIKMNTLVTVYGNPCKLVRNVMCDKLIKAIELNSDTIINFIIENDLIK